MIYWGLFFGRIIFVRMTRHAQRHLDTQLGGAGDRTSSLSVTSEPDLPLANILMMLPFEN